MSRAGIAPINRKWFFDSVRPIFGGRLTQKQVEGMEAVLNRWEQHHADGDDRWLAYMLATVFHESGRTMWPVEEIGKGRGKPYGVRDAVTGHVYYGRGTPQLTWKDNYRRLGRRIGVDLVHEPQRMLELGIATRVLFVGMLDGEFTGKKLGDYFSKTKDLWLQARRTVNKLDRARLIADLAKRFYAAISYTAASKAAA